MFYEKNVSSQQNHLNSKDGGQSHVTEWGEIDNTYRKIITRVLDEKQKNFSTL